MFDCHTHTKYSGHGAGSVEEVVSAASRLGMSTVALTEHLTLPDGLDPEYGASMSEHEALLYRDEVEAACRDHPEIEVIYGTEADWLGGETAFLREHLDGFEYILGSVHFLDGWGFDDPGQIDGWQERSVDAVWESYFDTWIAACASDLPFSCMSHPDLVKKFGFYPSFDVRELYEMAARAAADHGRMIEVNTAGLSKPVAELYPADRFLKAFCEAGVDCTIGSDAHSPAGVGAHFDQALAALVRAGYQRVAIPTRNGARRYEQL